MNNKRLFPRSFTVTEDTLEKLDVIAEKMNTTRSGALRQLVDERVKRWRIKKGAEK